MKIKSLQIVLFLLFNFISFAQDKEVEVVANLVDGNYVVSAKNNSNERKEVKITLDGTGKTDAPMVKLVNKGETLEFITIKPVNGKLPKFSYSSSWKAKPTDEELALKDDKLKTRIGLVNDDLSKGIVIFTKEGCPRCEKTINYLLEKDYNFKYYNTSASTEINQLMWKKIEEKKASDKITMPVILVNGKLTHSHADLTAFLKTVKQ